MKHHRHHHHHRRAVKEPDPTVVDSVISIGRGRGLSDDYLLTALMVGLQESGLQNLDHGDGTSLGWRQETISSYRNVDRRNVPASVNRFYDELSRTHRRKHQTLGHWGQAVQRSAFPDAYDNHLGHANEILKQYDAEHQVTATH